MIIESNGYDFDVETKNDVYDVLVNCGLDPFDIQDMFGILESEYEQERTGGWYIDKDEYERLCDGIQSEVNDLYDEIDNLNERSKKGNTRADIATRIKAIASNIEDINGSYL